MNTQALHTGHALTQTSYLIGLIGDGVLPSLSPPMHEREAQFLGIQYVYRPIDLVELGLGPESVGQVLEQASRLGFDGLNITHPCKQLVLEHLDHVSDEARLLRAVNTVTITDRGFTGYNTDHSGFARGFRQGLPDASLNNVLQLGAGGAGSAVAYALLGLGSDRLTVVDVDGSKAEKLVATLQQEFGKERVGAGYWQNVPALLAAADGLVNATPIGMAAHSGTPLNVSLLESRHWVADVIYMPIETELLRAARAVGCQTLDGGRMCVNQAADAFRIFTGIDPDPDRMRETFLAHTGQADARR
ncbi:MAG TPA: shikimate dehydrogenase [Arthrobacter sp.]|jgi:shikimate dehydrogenase